MRLVLGLIFSVLLASCFSVGKRGADTAMVVYDFGLVSQHEAPTKRQAPIAVEVRAPLWFDSLGIDYRLNYAEPVRLREYTRARWVGPPAQLIQQRLIRDLALIPAGQGRAGCMLRIDIEEFSQIFDSPTSSRGVLQGRAQWLDRSRNQLAERRIDITHPAPSADSLGGVTALTTAVDSLNTLLRRWEATLLESGKLRSCQS